MKLLCWLGLHWFMRRETTLFWDRVSGEEIFLGTCPCGRRWMHASVFGMPFFRVLHRSSKENL